MNVKMARKGNYTNYNGKEYKIVRTKESEIFLLSNDNQDVEKGFEKYAEGVYQKKVNESELTDVFYVHPVGKYKGHEFDVIVNQSGDKVNLGTNNAKLAEELGFNRTDKFYYEKVVSADEVVIDEIKKSTVI
ncbi:hypothetical protein [Fredinandcohnia sp. 179-A 10B2 NHS]|uniref:hypothetical protein n=1 Tax=Fredinandcohnia sp. 179-A 10B2 NHS TaxID=3235176 RepID=UPI0039A36E08